MKSYDEQYHEAIITMGEYCVENNWLLFDIYLARVNALEKKIA